MTNPNLGKTLTFKTPSGFDVTIREQDGADDETISKLKNAMDGTAVNKLVSSIITDYKGGRVTPETILKFKNRDKYYILFKSRVFSIGDSITYKHKCPNLECQKDTIYEEDLNQYDRDFSKPEEETKTDFPYQVQPYINADKLEEEIGLSSGKKVKYKYLNGESEKKLLAANKDEINKNTELLVRDIQWWHEDKFQPLMNFKVMSTKDMAEIRKHIKLHDSPFEAISEVRCPVCQTTDKISLMAQTDFFFPQEIL